MSMTVVSAREEVYAELEGDWASVIGSAQVEQLRGCRARVLRATNGGELPPLRPSW